VKTQTAKQLPQAGRIVLVATARIVEAGIVVAVAAGIAEVAEAPGAIAVLVVAAIAAIAKISNY
jgi:hypothetical protein